MSLLANAYLVTYVFAAMFLALTILLGLRLDQWSPNHRPGRCYYADLVTTSGADHPAADKTYVAFTAAWMLLVMAASILLGTRMRRVILILAFLQFPVHLYMAIALRESNQPFLEVKDEDENGWDFGQTTAVVLLAVALGELFRKQREYVRFERRLCREGLSNQGPRNSQEAPQSDEEEGHGESETHSNKDLMAGGSGPVVEKDTRRRESVMSSHARPGESAS